MTYIQDLSEGLRLQNTIYLLHKITNGTTKAGKPFLTYELQDKTGTINAMVWTPDSPAFHECAERDYICVSGEVTSFNGRLQMKLESVSVANEGTYNPADYLPVSDRDVEEMYGELIRLVESVKTDYLNTLLESFFKDENFKKSFCFHSAAKSVHHGFVGGLLEHTLSVAQACNFFAKQYPMLDRDLLITAALCHDIGKTKEISAFPENDYTDDGQLLGHIVIGYDMLRDRIAETPNFPEMKARELLHCILAHHGELEFGSPKKPALMEAMALSFADNMDAKMETMKEALKATAPGNTEWQGYNRFLETNIRRTSPEE